MPRALVVTYQWLPMFSVGVKHVATLCRSLPAAGWEPHILTKDWNEGPAPEDAHWMLSPEPIEGSSTLKHAATLPVIRTPYALRDNRWLRREANLEVEPTGRSGLTLQSIERQALDIAYPFFGHYPDMHRGWVEPAVEAGIAAVRQYGIGAVVSVCPPASAHLVGGEIARRAGIPWVVLFSDLAEFYDGPDDGRSYADRWNHRAVSKRWLQGASRSACVSPQMVDYVRDTYGVNGDVVVVPFDPEERRVAPHRAAHAPMSILHAGSIHPRDQQPQLLFDALDQLVALSSVDVEALRVTLVGSGCNRWLEDQVRDRPCAAMTRILDRVPAAEALRMQREADVLVTFNYRSPISPEAGSAHSYPSKMFEHWNAMRPTVAIGSDAAGFVGKLLSETGAGQTAEDAQSLSAVLLDYLAELRRTGTIAFRGEESAIARYGGPEQAKRLAALLDAASAERFGSWQRA